MQRFYLPTEVITGAGCLAQLGPAAAGHGQRVIVVCGQRFARNSGLLDRAIQLLRAEGLTESVFDGVSGEADLAIVEAGIDLARQSASRVVLGLGGGSAIDTGKAIAGMATLPGSVWEYHEGRPLEHAGLPFLAVPTTAGTGAEVTKNAVLINPKTEVKNSIRADSWFARAAFVDPETTVSMPSEITASTGSDALCQAIEAFTSLGSGPLTDALAMRAIELIGRSLERACAEGGDLVAREEMCMGSLMAGMAMASARLGGVHGMAHPLGSHYHIAHGVVCGLLLPYTMSHNLEYAIDKYATVGRLLGDDNFELPGRTAAERGVERVRRLLDGIGIPKSLRAFGIREDDFEQIIRESLPSGSLKHNPRPLGAEDVRSILTAAL